MWPPQERLVLLFPVFTRACSLVLLFAVVSDEVWLDRVLGFGVRQNAVCRLQRGGRFAGFELDFDGISRKRVIVDDHARLPRNLASFLPLVHPA